MVVPALLAFPGHTAHAQDDPVLAGRVSQVTDGDTIKVQLSSGPITVRLDSIDAPENNQPAARPPAARWPASFKARESPSRSSPRTATSGWWPWSTSATAM
jgi:endonuclease YncB( thermonuclease family)